MRQRGSNIQPREVHTDMKITKSSLRKYLCLILACTLVLSMYACGGIKPINNVKYEYPPSTGSDNRIEYMKANTPDESFVAAVNGFSYRTADKLLTSGTEGGTNICYSPLSLYLTLALATAGADGETRSELAALIGYDSEVDTAVIAENCGKLLRRISSKSLTGHLKIANSLWVDDSIELIKSFADMAADSFFASVYSADLQSSDTQAAMKRWVKDNTSGSIDPVIYVDPLTILSLMNTVDFTDQWIDRFDASNNNTGVFHAPNEDINVEYMNSRYSSHYYAYGDKWVTSSLGLKDAASMVFILPDEGISPEELISEYGIDALINGGEAGSGEVIWQLPKFKFETKTGLDEMIKEMGAVSAYDHDNADFAGITSFKPVWIGSIVQQTVIEIDEKGVSAAAFTNIQYAGAAMPEGRADMILDRPFIFAVTSYGGIPLFAGVVNQPTVK